MSEFSSTWYMDNHGTRWFCVRRENGMVCEGEHGSFTAANFETFRRWGWTVTTPPQKTA